MAIMQIVISPKTKEGESISKYVAEVQKVLQESKFPCMLHDMGTLIEGKAGELFTLARKIHEIPFKMGSSRVYTMIQIDDRRDKVVHLGNKIKSVRNQMKKR